jgi:hypothetical protein
VLAGGPAFVTFLSRSETVGAPSSRFLQGRVAMPPSDPPLTVFACTIPTEGAPSLSFLQGWVAMLRALFGFVVDT